MKKWVAILIVIIITYLSFMLEAQALTTSSVLKEDIFNQYNIYSKTEIQTMSDYFDNYFKGNTDKVMCSMTMKSYDLRSINNYTEFVCGSVPKLFTSGSNVGADSWTFKNDITSGTIKYFKYDLNTREMSEVSRLVNSFDGFFRFSGKVSMFPNSNYAIFWINGSYKYEDFSYGWSDRSIIIDSTFNLDSRYTSYYTLVNYVYPEYPLYSISNLVLGNFGQSVEVSKYAYKIEYYFDDLLDSSKTFIGTSEKNSIVTNSTDYSDSLYSLYSDSSIPVSITISENEIDNVLRVYYRSALYGTDKKPIDTNVDSFYFFYNFNDIKTMFPSIQFANFTQYQQFVIVILFNMFYALFLLLILYIMLKAIFKALGWLTSYFL